MSTKKTNRGGFREGAGLKPKWGCDTKVVRVPVVLLPDLYKKMERLAKKEASKNLK